MSGHVLPLVGSTESWHGGVVTDSATCILAPNPSPWTLDGTNTWLLSAPGSGVAAVVDPGPDDPGHAEAVRAAADERGTRIAVVLLTHGHLDHSEGARAFAESVGVGVRVGVGVADSVGVGVTVAVVTNASVSFSSMATPTQIRHSSNRAQHSTRKDLCSVRLPCLWR